MVGKKVAKKVITNATKEAEEKAAKILRRQQLNEKFGRTGDVNRDINLRKQNQDAVNSYKKLGYDKDQIKKEIKGTNLNNSEIKNVNSGKKMVRWEDPTINLGKNPGGNYGTPQTGSKVFDPKLNPQPTELGINPQKELPTGNKVNKIPVIYESTKPTTVFESTANPIVDTWSTKTPYPTKGGGKQWLILEKDAWKRIDPK